jgi:macrolide-specific efflux system membrane fusion protein
MTLKDDVTARSKPAVPHASPDATPRRSLTAEWRRFGLPHKGWHAWVLIGGVLLAAGIFTLFVLPRIFRSPAADYITAPVERGSIEDTVTALGNLQPLTYVDVGAQVSGQIQTIHVIIGDKVKKGDLLVEIDPKVQQEKVDQSKSQLDAMKATLVDRQATLKLRQAQAARETSLHAQGADSLDAYQAALAAVASAQSAVTSQLAQIAQAESSLSADETTLSYSKILAPMDGTVVSLTLKQGQTINASQQTPTILRIADLSTMTVWTQVSEADISRLRVGMPAYFTTLGDPNTRHEGKLRQVLPTPEITNNVILYDVLFDVANPAQTLMTQMTAQVFFTVASAENALTVPVAALQMARTLGGGRTGQAGGGARNRAGAGGASGQSPNGGARGDAQSGSGSGQSAPTDAQRQAWRQAGPNGGGARQFVIVLAGGKLERRAVTIGVTNRISAEVKFGLRGGEPVVVGRKQTQKPPAASSSRSPLQTGPGGPGGPRGGR